MTLLVALTGLELLLMMMMMMAGRMFVMKILGQVSLTQRSH